MDEQLIKITEEIPDTKKEDVTILSLSELELFKLRAFEAEKRAAATEAKLLSLQKENFIKLIDPEGRLAAFDRKIKETVVLHNTATIRYRTIIEETEKRLNISMKDFSFDDETGVLLPNT
jgi:hypothetical protein